MVGPGPPQPFDTFGSLRPGDNVQLPGHGWGALAECFTDLVPQHPSDPPVQVELAIVPDFRGLVPRVLAGEITVRAKVDGRLAAGIGSDRLASLGSGSARTEAEDLLASLCLHQAGFLNVREHMAVEAVDSSYRPAEGSPEGWFQTGQPADIVLSGFGFDDAGGSLLFNHPGNIASDGTRLLLADTRNNRVLIWNQLPTGNTPPDLVLGHQSLTGNAPGVGLHQLNWPGGVSIGGQRLVVADTENHRLLIWNSFPTRNGQAADLVLQGDRSLPRLPFTPYSVWTDGETLAAADRGAGRVHIWHSFPTRDGQPADVVLGLDASKAMFGSPRYVASDGRGLVVADYDPPANNRRSATFFFRTMPTHDDQPPDFMMAAPSVANAPPDANAPDGGTDLRRFAPGEMLRPAFTADGKMVVLGDPKLYVWDAFPASAGTPPVLALGTSRPLHSSIQHWGGEPHCPLAPTRWRISPSALQRWTPM